jgi:hypothetical protein
MSHSIAILNTGKTMNPYTNEGEYAENGLIYYIVRPVRSGAPSKNFKVWSSWYGDHKDGANPSPYTIGQQLIAHADQTGRDLGDYILEGWIAYDRAGNAIQEGNVPSRKLSHHVFK